MEEINHLNKILEEKLKPHGRKLLGHIVGLALIFISERFHKRGLEWFLAAVMAFAGVILLVQGETFALSPYAFIKEIAAEETWGFAMAMIGGIRIIALMVNGVLPRGVPHVRVVMSLVSLIVWSEFAIGYLTARVPSLMIAFTVPACLFEMINAYRAATDAKVEDRS